MIRIPVFQPGEAPVADETGRLQVLAVPLNTTRDAAVLGFSRAAGLRNCDTSRGVFGRDRRYRRVQVPPSATIIGEACTNLLAPDTASSTARSGSTVAWTDPTNAVPPDGIYASALIEIGDKTETLVVTEFAPTGVPVGATLTRLRVQILARATAEEDDLPVDVVDDLVRLTIDGIEVGTNGATLTPLPSTAAVREYEFSPSGAGITAGMILAGRIGAHVGYRSEPSSASVYDAENWDVTVDVVGATGGAELNSVSLSPTYTITPDWIGGGTAPLKVVVEIESSASASTTDIATGTALANDGQGGTDEYPVGTPTPPSSASSETTKRVLLVPGADHTVSPTASATNPTAVQEGEIPVIGCSASTDLTAVIAHPDPATVEVDSVQLIVCYETEIETTTTPQGVGIGRFAGEVDVAAVIGGGAFDIAAADSQGAMGDDWREERSGTQLDAGNWSIWPYAQWLFYANPDGGVYRRTIGENDWEPVYRDADSPGNTGDAVATSVRPPYDSIEFDAGVDTLTVIGTGGSGLTIHEEEIKADGKVWLRTNDWVTGGYGLNWIEFEVEFGTAKVLDRPMALAFLLDQGTYDDETWLEGNDGFNDRVADNQLILTGGGDSVTLPSVVRGKLNQKEGTYVAWFDVSAVDAAILEDLEKVQIRFGVYQTGRAEYRLTSFVAGGTRYHDQTGTFEAASETNTDELEYAYDYSEGSAMRSARKLKVVAKTHLGGGRVFASTPVVPYLGSVQSVRVPTADAPYTTAATINLYRKVGDVYQRIATGSNSEDLVFEDRLPDSEVAGDTVAYPVTTMDFTAAPPSSSGVATGVICGCAWKGSNVYAGEDGKIYFSRTNFPTEVEWENVVLTNDPGSEDLGPPRTSTVADDTTSPVITLVSAENLYCFTRTECYVFVSGDTAYNASFPRKIDGVRGAIGPRAACAYGDRALVGCDDGLWAIKKSTSFGEQPDELAEITSEIRGSWLWLLGDSPTTLVVRQIGGDIWVFNESRYLHITREGNPIEGEWADERTVFDAVADTEYGLILLLGDGHLGVIGDFPTDGGTDVGGTDGEEFEWSFLSGMVADGNPLRAHVHYLTTDDAASVKVKATTEKGDSELTFAGSVQRVANEPFSRGGLGGGFSQFEVRGGPKDTVRRLTIEFQARTPIRGR